MMDCFAKPGAAAVPIAAVAAKDFKSWLAGRDASTRAWVTANGFSPKAGRHLAVPNAKGRIGLVVLGRGDDASMWDFGDLPKALPAGRYRLEGFDGKDDQDGATAAALAWALGSYQFARYKAGAETPAKSVAKLVWPAAADRAKVEREAKGTFLCRDLINMPTNDMGPADLADAATLRENVTSPNGVTYEALKVLMDDQTGMTPLLTRALTAASRTRRARAVCPPRPMTLPRSSSWTFTR